MELRTDKSYLCPTTWRDGASSWVLHYITRFLSVKTSKVQNLKRLTKTSIRWFWKPKSFIVNLFVFIVCIPALWLVGAVYPIWNLIHVILYYITHNATQASTCQLFRCIRKKPDKCAVCYKILCLWLQSKHNEPQSCLKYVFELNEWSSKTNRWCFLPPKFRFFTFTFFICHPQVHLSSLCCRGSPSNTCTRTRSKCLRHCDEWNILREIVQ